MRRAPQARIVVLDRKSGRLLALSRLEETARTLAAPGSTLKPLLLYQLIDAGRWRPERRVSCDRRLRVGGHAMACSHPEAPPMDAESALAWSCNSYFAQVAGAVPLGGLRGLLEPTGLWAATGLAAGEARAELREPGNLDEMRLAVLGTEGVRVTPLWLALQLAAHPGTPASLTVRTGLGDSASFGIAEGAGRGGVPVMGKTGTAKGVGSAQTHGWFAGIASADKMEAVVVVYLPAGRGSDAARVAAEVLAHSPLRQP
jgi:cell division protein FtsI/penicillin-binding protein 2